MQLVWRNKVADSCVVIDDLGARLVLFSRAVLRCGFAARQECPGSLQLLEA